MTSFADYLKAVVADVERTLEELLPKESAAPGRLHAAMRYATFAGGKRVRPGLLVLSGESFGARREDLLEAASAFEMIHTFSLVHDDLPALDDDDLRRGHPTLHRQFDEALAILAGDALLNLGLEVLAERPRGAAAESRLAAVQIAARAVGSFGMIGGQVEDLEAEGRELEVRDAKELLHRIHERKTGALIRASLQVGAVLAGAAPETTDGVRELGDVLGLMFQIQDDILDVESTSEVLGKTAGKDERVSKLTFPRVFGLEESRLQLATAGRKALGVLERLSSELDRAHAEVFADLVSYLGRRRS